MASLLGPAESWQASCRQGFHGVRTYMEGELAREGEGREGPWRHSASRNSSLHVTAADPHMWASRGRQTAACQSKLILLDIDANLGRPSIEQPNSMTTSKFTANAYDRPTIVMVLKPIICHLRSTPTLIPCTIVNTYIPIDSENVHHLNIKLMCWFYVIYQ